MYLRFLATVLCVVTVMLFFSCAGFQPQLRMVDPEIVVDPKFGTCARTGGTMTVDRTQLALLSSICYMQTGDVGVTLNTPVEYDAQPKIVDATENTQDQ